MNSNLEKGKVVSVTYGPSMGNIGMVIDIIDEKRCVIDGPCGRQIINFKRIKITNIKIKIQSKMTSKGIYQKFRQHNILKTWLCTPDGKKFLRNKNKEKLTDFAQFKHMMGKKHLSNIVNLRKELNE